MKATTTSKLKIVHHLLFLSCLPLAPLNAGPGEKGRPKVTPRFETWAGDSARRALSGTSIEEKVEALRVHDLNGTQFALTDLWKDKPLFLIHSSLTCPISRDNCPHLDRIKEHYSDKSEVVVLYTTEAHLLVKSRHFWS